MSFFCSFQVFVSSVSIYSTLIQTGGVRKGPGVRACEWFLNCQCYKLQQFDETAFADGKVSKMGIKTESVKKEKTAGEKRGIEMMEHKLSKRKKVQTSTKADKTYSQNQPETRRTTSVRSESKESRCQMKITIFMGKDGYFYLSSTSILDHTNHTAIPPPSKSLSEKDVTSVEMDWLKAMIDVGLNPTQISMIMEQMMEKEGDFSTKLVHNLSQKLKTVKEKILGVGNDWSSAEKTMKCLERYDYCISVYESFYCKSV